MTPPEGRRPRASRLLSTVPPYPFAELERAAKGWHRDGRGVLDFSIGDPDLPPPAAVRDAAQAALAAPDGHRYSTSRGEPDLREAIARWMRRRFGVILDPDSEIAVLLGSKEGLTAFPRAVLDPGDGLLVPDPGYPAYRGAALLGPFRPCPVPLRPERGYRLDPTDLPREGRLLYANYPHNPTGAVADRAALQELADAAADRDLWVAYDNAYSEVTFDSTRAPSFLEFPGARARTVEFHSLSKTFGLAGWRIGFAVGDSDLLAPLVQLKSQVDSGAPRPLQRAAVAALELYRGADRPPEVQRSVDEYGRRMACLVNGLRERGYPVELPGGTLYLWQRAPDGDGAAFAHRLLTEHGLLVTPGSAFGAGGAPFVRWSVTRPLEVIEEAVRRLPPAPSYDGCVP